MKSNTIKISLLAVGILLLRNPHIFGQTQVTRYTPNGSPVRAYNNIQEMNTNDKKDWSAHVRTHYPNAKELNVPSATTSYNCHGYAWHVAEGGDPVWIGYYQGQEADEDIYWEDYSYLETTEALAEKISYYQDNHSAIQTEILGTYVSKWGVGPLMQHAQNYGPSEYKMNYRKYYKRPKITGPTTICKQNTYTISNLPQGATVQWGYSLNILPVDNQNSTIVVKRLVPPASSGEGWISAKVTVENNQFDLPIKTVWLGTPLKPNNITFIPSILYTRQRVIANTSSNNPPIANAQYKWRGGGFTDLSNPYGWEIYFKTFDSPVEYTLSLYVSAENECGCSSEYEEFVNVIPWGGGDEDPDPAGAGKTEHSNHPSPTEEIL